MKINYLFLFLMLPFLFSCEGEKIDYTIINRSINVYARIDGMNTRATNSEWAAGDAIGIYMVTAGEVLSAESALARNAKYSTQGDGVFTPTTIANDVKFPIDRANVDFIAYYPQGTVTAAFGYSLNVTDQSNQATIDVMYSNNEVGRNSAHPEITLRFAHKLTKLVFNIAPSVAGTDLSGLNVKLVNFNPRGTMLLADGSVSYTNTKGDIRLKVSEDGKTAEAIVIPTTDLAGKKLVIEHGTIGYDYDLSSAANITEFQSGYRYTYNLTLDPTIAVVSVSAAATITAWNEGPSESVTLNKKYDVYQPVGEGTQENPYTIEDARALSPLTGVWVKGNIVGYYSGNLPSFTNNPAKPAAEFTAFAIAVNPEESVASNTFPVQLPTGAIRTAIYEGYENNFKKEIKVKGNIGTYYSTIGIQNTSAYEFISP